MRKTKVAVVLGAMFVLAMAAGVVTGRLTTRAPTQNAPQQYPGLTGGSPLADELQLSRAQSEQMRPIWEAARDTARSCAAEAEQVQRDHEQQLRAMLTDEQKAQYERMSQENHRRIEVQDARRREA